MTAPARTNLKRDLFEQFARIGQAIANGHRLEMLEFLAQRERSVDELARMAGLSVANTSQHLQRLRSAGLVAARKQGLRVHYRLAGDEVFELWQSVRRIGETRLPEIDKLVRSRRPDRHSLEVVSLRELRQRMRDSRVTLLDVRPPEEYEQGHIPGARSIPLAELQGRLRDLPKGTEIVAYCRGPFCFLSDDAVVLLRSRGRRAARLEQGFPDWKAMGWRVEFTTQRQASP